MEDRETARMRRYGESKTTRIMMATIPHVISGLGFRKFQADGFLLTRVYNGETAEFVQKPHVVVVNPQILIFQNLNPFTLTQECSYCLFVQCKNCYLHRDEAPNVELTAPQAVSGTHFVKQNTIIRRLCWWVH